MITVLDAQRLIRHYLGGDDPPSEIGAITIINEAGEHLVNMRRWNWLIRPEVFLNFTAGQNYVDLPSDFGEVIGLFIEDSLNGALLPTGLSEVYRGRADPLPRGPQTYYWSVEWVGSAGTAAPRPRIALDGPPTDSTANAMRLLYRASWTRVEADGDVLVIPTWSEGLYRALLEATAKGHVEEDALSLSERIERVEQGPLLRYAIARDAQTQVMRGQLRGGAAQQGIPGKLYNRDNIVGPPVSY